MEPIQNNEEELEALEPTLSPKQWRELGSAEANAWTITPPGGVTMSLDEVEAYRQQQELQRQEHLRIYAEEEEREARIRSAQAQTAQNATDERKNGPDA